MKIAEGCGYKTFNKVKTETELTTILNDIKGKDGPHFIEILIRPGVRSDLGRPKMNPVQSKTKFMEFLRI